MKIILSIFFFIIHGVLFSSDLEFNKNIIFQKNSISQNNIISEISNSKDLSKLIELTEYKDNFFYALFDPLTNSNIFPSYSSQIEFFFEKINLFYSKSYGNQINASIFENVIFDKFEDPNSNRSYLNYLFYSNQIKSMCSYLSSLNENQKSFGNSIQYNIICLLDKKQYSQILLLLEIYNEDDIIKLNSNFLMSHLSNQVINKKYNLSELSIIDKYIISLSKDVNVNTENISNLFELDIYMKKNDLDLLQINYLFKKRIINVEQYISLLNVLDEKPNVLKMYNDLKKEINYNKKLSILESYIPLISLDFYDLSRLINEQFNEMRITTANLEYINSLMLLSLYENSFFLESLILILKDIPNNSLENNYTAQAIKNYLLSDFNNNLYIDDDKISKSPLMKFLFLNGNINFSDAKIPESNIEDTISISPIYLFNLTENYNLLDSYIYYVSLSEKYYSINEYDLYFLNKYLIQNTFIKNELIKLFFKVHLSNI